MPPPPPPPQRQIAQAPTRTYNAAPPPPESHSSNGAVSQYAYNCHERRGMLLSPDRRNFMQSMPFEAAMRVKGNSVSSDVSKRYAYTFKHENYDPAKKPPRGRLDWLHESREEAPPRIDDRRRDHRDDRPSSAYDDHYHHQRPQRHEEREVRYERVENSHVRRYDLPEDRSSRRAPSRGRATPSRGADDTQPSEKHRRLSSVRDERRQYEDDRRASTQAVPTPRAASRSRYEERSSKHEERWSSREDQPEERRATSSRARSPRVGRQ